MSENNKNFLSDVANEEGGEQITLVRLKELVEEQKRLTKKVEEAEEILKMHKGMLRKVEEEDIPMLLTTANLSEIKLSTGEKVTIKKQDFITIEDQEAYFKFLEDRNEDDIIKLNMKFSKMSIEKKKALVLFLKEYDYDSDDKVYYQTTQKYFRELFGSELSDAERQCGLEMGSLILKEDITSFAKVYTSFKTKIK